MRSLSALSSSDASPPFREAEIPTKKMSWVLGICDGHNGGAALVDEEGHLAWAVSEERLSRTKRQAGFPYRAVKLAMEERLARGGRLEAVAIAERSGRVPFRLLDRWYAQTGTARGPLGSRSKFAAAWSQAAVRYAEGSSERLSRRILRRRLLDVGLGHVPFGLVDHHDCHAWSAAAGADDALVITMDAFGDGISGGIYRLQRGLSSHPRLSRCRRVPAPHGASIVFGAVTQMLGFHEGDEGKVVARAAAGDPDRLRAVFERTLVLRDGLPWLEGSLEELVERLRGEPENDVAAALQAHIERIVLDVIRGAIRDFGGRRLRLAGGLFANVALNRAIAHVAANAGLLDVFVFPAMGDAGLCAGAALAARAARGGQIRGMTDARIGPLAWDESAPLPVRVPPLPITEDPAPVRGALNSGEVVARCTRRMEFGPRALGSRSLLFRANDVGRGARLNERLGRDPRMPFGPVILAEDAKKLLVGWGPETSPMTHFMTVALPATEHMRSIAPGAVHADGTTRAQVLRREDDPALHAMLLDVPERLVINTSLNLHGEPIVCTLQEAATTSAAAGASLLWVG